MRCCVPVLTVTLLFVSSVAAQTARTPTSDAAKELFSHYDNDSDGVIKGKELENIHYPMLIQADSNGDGELTREEITSFISPKQPKQKPPRASQQLSKLLGGKRGNMLGGVMVADGKVMGDLLGATSSARKKATNKPIPKSVGITFVALQLPDNFASNDMVTLKEMASGLAGGVKESELEKIGIRLLDLYEFSAVDGMEAQLNFERAQHIKDAVYDNRQRSFVKFNLGSSLRVTPHTIDSGVTLDVHYSTSVINRNDRGVRQVGSQSRLLLTDENRTKLINLYNEGVHYLLVVSAKVQ